MSSEAVQQFSAVTGADAEMAKFWLETSQGNLEAAVAAYFEQEGDAAESQQQPAIAAATSQPPAAQPPAAQQPASRPPQRAQPSAAQPAQSRGQ